MPRNIRERLIFNHLFTNSTWAQMNQQKDSLNVEQVFDVSAKRYDAWYNKPFGKSAFTLEKACIESLLKNLKQPFLEVGVGTGRFAQALK
jgi:ubiquinone/menaquinone biosynthesis C-methylase UbiE